MSRRTQVRDAIEHNRAQVQKWRALFQAKDDQQDEISDAIDEARVDLGHLRRLRDGLVKGRRHEHWTEQEIEKRRHELASEIADGLDVIDHLIERLQSVKDKKQKARRHLKHHEKKIERLQKKLDFLKAHRDPSPPPPSGNLVTFDGHTCAGWIVREALVPARASGTWTGSVISGFRSPEYSTSLCENMCGQPSCPGTCAGAASNHSCPVTHTCQPYEGAVDVLDAAGLRAWCSTHGWPIVGGGVALPNDVPHFSRSGR